MPTNEGPGKRNHHAQQAQQPHQQQPQGSRRRTSREALLATLERMLELPAENLAVACMRATDLIAAALQADKVDAFMYEAAKDQLVAIGSSAQPLSTVQKLHGLDVLPVANGGRVVSVYKTGQSYLHGHVDEDEDELRGFKETLQIRSAIGVPLIVGGAVRGMVMIASREPQYFDAEDLRFAESMVRWVGLIAQRAELVEEIARAAAEQGRRSGAEELVTHVAHELRNSISPLDLRLHAIKRRAVDEARSKDVEDIDKAQRNLRRLLTLISEILDVARVDQGMFQLELRPVSIGALVEEVAELLSTPQQTIEVRIAEELIILADASRLRHCMENILANAVKHSPRGAPVTVNISREPTRDGEWTRIEIIDDGPGVPLDLLPRLFERYATDHAHGGLGLGLYLARRIVDLHAGTIDVDVAPGRGARFVVRLPLALSGEGPGTQLVT